MAHKIQVRNRPGAEGKITTGANTEVLLDGKKLNGCRFVKIEVDARKVAKVMLELYAEVEVEVESPLDHESTKDSGLLVHGKPLSVHTISSYSPKFLAQAAKEKYCMAARKLIDLAKSVGTPEAKAALDSWDEGRS